VPSLRPGLAESRQFGGCFVIGVQVFSALRDLYGRDGAETISGLCGTRVVLAAPDRDTAEWSAESLGRAEIEETSESVNYGAVAPRDGVSLGARRALRPLVLPAEVARLENLSGYLKLPGAWPVARIRLRYRKRPKRAERFVPREETGIGSRPAETRKAAVAGSPDGTAAAMERESGTGPRTGQSELDLPPMAAARTRTPERGNEEVAEPSEARAPRPSGSSEILGPAAEMDGDDKKTTAPPEAGPAAKRTADAAPRARKGGAGDDPGGKPHRGGRARRKRGPEPARAKQDFY